MEREDCLNPREDAVKLEPDSHLQFIKDLDGRVKKLDYWQADYLRMNGIYWALTSLLLLRPGLCSKSDDFALLSPLTRDEIIAFVQTCECTDGMKCTLRAELVLIGMMGNPRQGGFGGNAGHDAHLTFTLSAIQILYLLEAKDEISDWERHVECTLNFDRFVPHPLAHILMLQGSPDDKRRMAPLRVTRRERLTRASLIVP